jgi:hypothetical protein
MAQLRIRLAEEFHELNTGDKNAKLRHGVYHLPYMYGEHTLHHINHLSRTYRLT